MAYSPSSYLFTHLLQDVYAALTQTIGLIATGGTDTTIVDTKIDEEVQDDEYKNMYAFIAYDAGGAGAAPEGEYKRVTAYAQTGTTLTLVDALSAAVEADDHIVLARQGLFKLPDVINQINFGLKSLGDIPYKDTSLTTANNQTEYNVPSTIQWNRIKKVQIQGIINDADDNQYQDVQFHVIPPTATGGTATIELAQPPSGRSIRIIAVQRHPDLREYDDPIDVAIHPALATAAGALQCARLRDNAWKTKIPGLEDVLNLELHRHPLTRIIKRWGGMPQWNTNRYYPGDQDIFDA